MTTNRCRHAFVALLLLLVAGTATAQDRSVTPVTDAMLQAPDPADWPMWRRTLDGWGYSPLDEIDRANVGALRMVWSRGMTEGAQQGTPLVYDGVMYMPNPRDVNGRFRALDQETGEVLWEINLGSSVSGFPIAFAVDGRQYIAVSTGTPRFLDLTPELRPSFGNNLFVFALP